MREFTPLLHSATRVQKPRVASPTPPHHTATENLHNEDTDASHRGLLSFDDSMLSLDIHTLQQDIPEEALISRKNGNSSLITTPLAAKEAERKLTSLTSENFQLKLKLKAYEDRLLHSGVHPNDNEEGHDSTRNAGAEEMQARMRHLEEELEHARQTQRNLEQKLNYAQNETRQYRLEVNRYKESAQVAEAAMRRAQESAATAIRNAEASSAGIDGETWPFAESYEVLREKLSRAESWRLEAAANETGMRMRDEQISSLEEEIRASKQNETRVRTALEEERKKASILEADFAKCEVELRAANASREAIKRELEELQNNTTIGDTAMRDRLAQALQREEKLNHDVIELKNEKREIMNQLSEAQQEGVSQKKQNEELKKKLQDTKQRLEEIENANAKAEQLIRELRQNVSTVTASSKAVEVERDMLRERLDKSESEAKIAASKIRKLEQTASELNQDREHLNDNRAKLQTELEKANATVQQNNKEIARLKSHIKAYEADVAAAQTALERSHVQTTQLQEQLAAESRAAGEQILATREAQRAAIERANAAAKQAVMEAEAAAKLAQERLKERSSRIKTLEEALDAKSAEIEAQKTQLSRTTEISNSKLESLKVELASTQQQLSEAINQRGEALNALDEVRERAKRAERAQHAIDEREGKLERTIADLELRHQQLLNEVKGAQSDAMRAKQELSMVQAAGTAQIQNGERDMRLQAEVASLRAANDQLQQSIKRSSELWDGERAAASERIAKLQQLVDQFSNQEQARFMDHSSRIEQSARDALEREKFRFLTDKQLLERQLALARDQASEANKAYEQASRERANKEEVVMQLQQTVQAANEQLSLAAETIAKNERLISDLQKAKLEATENVRAASELCASKDRELVGARQQLKEAQSKAESAELEASKRMQRALEESSKEFEQTKNLLKKQYEHSLIQKIGNLEKNLNKQLIKVGDALDTTLEYYSLHERALFIRQSDLIFAKQYLEVCLRAYEQRDKLMMLRMSDKEPARKLTFAGVASLVLACVRFKRLTPSVPDDLVRRFEKLMESGCRQHKSTRTHPASKFDCLI